MPARGRPSAHPAPMPTRARRARRGELTYEQLYAEAKRLRIPGRSGMRKAELVRALAR